MIYTVTYFNPVGDCDNIAYVETDNDVDVALIAQAVLKSSMNIARML